MFDFTKEELMNKKAESKAMKMFSRMMSQAILESEKTPDYMKFSVLAMDKSEDVREALLRLVIMTPEMPLTERISAGDTYVNELHRNGAVKQKYNELLQKFKTEHLEGE